MVSCQVLALPQFDAFASRFSIAEHPKSQFNHMLLHFCRTAILQRCNTLLFDLVMHSIAFVREEEYQDVEYSGSVSYFSFPSLRSL